MSESFTFPKADKKERKKRTPSRKKPPKFRPITKGDLVNVIADVLEGEITVDERLLERMKKGYPKVPFGGERSTRDGGWNSISYGLIDAILSSERFYMKERER